MAALKESLDKLFISKLLPDVSVIVIEVVLFSVAVTGAPEVVAALLISCTI